MKKPILLLAAFLIGALMLFDCAVAQRPDSGGRGRGNRGERQRPELPQGERGFGEGGEGGEGGKRGFGGPAGPGAAGGIMRRLPMMTALDANDDGELSAEEIANAVQALKSLDTNSDGKLTMEELRPDFSGRGNGGGEFGPPPEGLGRADGPPQPRSGRAQRDPSQMVARMMGFDANGDEQLTVDEVPERMHGMMKNVDTNGDAVVTKAELTEFAASIGERRRGPSGRAEGRGQNPRGARPPRPARPTRPDSE